MALYGYRAIIVSRDLMTTLPDRTWVNHAIQAIHADFHRSADTHLLRFPLTPRLSHEGLSLYLKDESTHPTGSLKHRLARSLFLYGLCNGKITAPGTPVFEASSGSTAISEAYFAQLIGLQNFYAVVPSKTSEAKLKLIADYGGKLLLTDDDVVAVAKQCALDARGYFMDQFTWSERATDWRGNNNIAETIFGQMQREPEVDRVPQWIVCGAGTGGTSATIGRYVRYQGYATRVCVVDPPESIYYRRWAEAWNRPDHILHEFLLPSLIEGIGRPTAAESFVPEVIDAMVTVPNPASVGAMLYLHQTGRLYCGVSTGTNLIGAIRLLSRMKDQRKVGSVVTLLCDSGLRYEKTYYSADWRAQQLYPDGSTVYPEDRVNAYRDAVKAFLEQAIPFSPELLTGCIAEDYLND